MEVLSYINSKDIRDYLKKINYEFNSLEAAWLIYSCHRLSYNQKKEAWRELINTMPDCAVPSRLNCVGWDSLHLFLYKYMSLIDAEIDEFNHEQHSGSYVYMYSYLYEGDEGWTEEYDTIYPSLLSCRDAYLQDEAFLNSDRSDDKTGILRYRMKRQSLDDVKDTLEIEFLPDGQVKEILHNSKLTNEDYDVESTFDGLWFDFPTPFEKGDIVWVPKDKNRIRWDCDGGFVLKGLSTWNTIPFIKESGDNSDMNGYGYFVNPNGTVYQEVMYNYMDLEYYNGPYNINEKILPALSKFVKNEVDVDFLLCAYRKTLLDVAADDVMLKSWYSNEIIEEVGLNESGKG